MQSSRPPSRLSPFGVSLQPADSPCVRRAAVSFHGQGLPDPRGRSDLRQVAVRGALLGSAARPPKLPASVSQPANQAHKGSLPLWSNMVSSPPALEKDIYMQVSTIVPIDAAAGRNNVDIFLISVFAPLEGVLRQMSKCAILRWRCASSRTSIPPHTIITLSKTPATL